MKDAYTPMEIDNKIVVVVNAPEEKVYLIDKRLYRDHLNICTKYPTLEQDAPYWKERIGQRVGVEIKEVDEQVRYDNGEYAREIQFTAYAIPPQQKQGDEWEEAEHQIRECALNERITVSQLMEYLRNNYSITKRPSNG